ncbi:glutamine amidotransferase [Luteimonas aestuarii]|uniref:Glutamine amidotransferase n=1 Tax=Luteimonas aestuarii TaxID=453837 RepID=A0A4R5TJ07_9GAMM|nr:glutamine amidotransferase [Luteimonas aestuarii]TDK19569.1 glutamine amidotransferase [Luteimonas aestuarii]
MPPAPQPILIIETGQPVPSMRRHGGFPHWIRVAAGLRRDDAHVVDVEAGQTLPDADGFAGIIVTGSGAMVSHRLDWSERCAAWLRDAAHAGVPLFGICYGHQLIAHALGGEVGDHPAGREMGTVMVETSPQAGDDPLFAGLPRTFAAQATHLQSVLRLPDEAVLLAGNGHDRHHAFRWRESAWGVQFHPEFGTTHMRGYIRARADALAREGTCPRTLAAAVGAAPWARRVLRRFAALALRQPRPAPMQ